MLENIIKVLHNVTLYIWYKTQSFFEYMGEIKKDYFDIVPMRKNIPKEDEYDEIEDDFYYTEDVEDDDDDFKPYDGPVSMKP